TASRGPIGRALFRFRCLCRGSFHPERPSPACSWRHQEQHVMGFFDLFRGATDAEKALKLKPRVQQKYGEPITRQKAIEQLGELRVKESVEVLLHRFTFSVEPATTDLDEKERVLDLVGGFGELALEPVKSFLRRSDAGITWALRALGALVPEEEA